MSDPGTILLSRAIPFAPDVVWQALTSPELMAQWWAAGDVLPEVGHRFSLDMGGFGKQQCEVLDVEDEVLLEYSFGIGTLDTTIAWRLSDSDIGTMLYLEHTGFDLDTEMGQAAFRGMSAGWPSILARIEPALVASGAPRIG